jgi:hypothetical protein
MTPVSYPLKTCCHGGTFQPKFGEAGALFRLIALNSKEDAEDGSYRNNK